MPRGMWMNLPVADLERSRAFFEGIGFEVSANDENDDLVAVRVGTTQAMLVTRERFARWAGAPASEPGSGAEVLVSFDAASREEVDALAARVEKAGGTLFDRPGGQDGMYGMGFLDPDGHRWNALYMDAWGSEAP